MIDPRHGRESAIDRLAPWCLWAVGVATAFYPAILSGFERLQIERGDPRLIEYLVDHSWRFVRREPLHLGLWDPPFFYPVTGAGAFTDTMLGAVAPYGFFRLLGLASGPSFQLWMMVCLSLCFLATYLLLRSGLGLRRWPSATGAFLTGFGISRLANFNSPQLFTLFWGLFALVTLSRALTEASGDGPSRAPRFIVATVALLVLQVWSAFYPAFFFGLVLAIAAVLALCLPPCRTPLVRLLTRHPVVWAAALVGGGLAVLPMARAHLSVIDEVGWRELADVQDHLPPLWSWVFPGQRNFLYQRLGIAGLFELPGAPSQFSNGLGFATTVVSTLGLFLDRRRRPVAALVLATTAAVIVLTTVWPGGGSLWSLVWNVVPGAQAIRYPARIGMLLTITGSIGLALFLERASRLPRVAVVGIAGLCLIEQPTRLRAQPERPYRAAVESIAADIDPGCEAFFLSRATEVATDATPDTESARGPREKEKWTQLAGMWASIEAGTPTVNGYAGNEPIGWRPLVHAGHENEGRATLDERLAQWSAERGIRGRLCHVEQPPERMPWNRR